MTLHKLFDANASPWTLPVWRKIGLAALGLKVSRGLSD